MKRNFNWRNISVTWDERGRKELQKQARHPLKKERPRESADLAKLLNLPAQRLEHRCDSERFAAGALSSTGKRRERTNVVRCAGEPAPSLLGHQLNQKYKTKVGNETETEQRDRATKQRDSIETETEQRGKTETKTGTKTETVAAEPTFTRLTKVSALKESGS